MVIEFEGLQQEIKQLQKDKDEIKMNYLEEQEKVIQLETTLEELKTQLKEAQRKILRLENKEFVFKKDMEFINNKLFKQSEICNEIELSKIQLQKEMEDLSEKLFEEANEMVRLEKVKYNELNKNYKNLLNKNIQLNLNLEDERLQIRELKEKFYLLTSEKKISEKELSKSLHSRSKSMNNQVSYSTINSVLMSKSQTSESNRSSIESSQEEWIQNEHLSFYTNDFRYKEFKEYINYKEKGLFLSSKYMKRTIVEDIEPCLNFNVNKSLDWKLHRFLLRSAQEGSVNIVLCTETELKEKKLALNDGSCYCCANSENSGLKYRFSIGTNSTLMSKLICNDCRERLIHVCEYFSFLRMIRNGVLKSSPESLYLDSLNLKLSLFYSRIGAKIPIDKNYDLSVSQSLNC